MVVSFTLHICGLNWDQKITALFFLLLSPIFLPLDFENVLGGDRKPHILSRNLVTFKPWPTLMDQTGVMCRNEKYMEQKLWGLKQRISANLCSNFFLMLFFMIFKL